jgi:hypothetical protein
VTDAGSARPRAYFNKSLDRYICYDVCIGSLQAFREFLPTDVGTSPDAKIPRFACFSSTSMAYQAMVHGALC